MKSTCFEDVACTPAEPRRVANSRASLDALQQAILLNPRDAAAYLARGETCAPHGDRSRAKVDFDLAKKFGPTLSLQIDELLKTLVETQTPRVPDSRSK